MNIPKKKECKHRAETGSNHRPAVRPGNCRMKFCSVNTYLQATRAAFQLQPGQKHAGRVQDTKKNSVNIYLNLSYLSYLFYQFYLQYLVLSYLILS